MTMRITSTINKDKKATKPVGKKAVVEDDSYFGSNGVKPPKKYYSQLSDLSIGEPRWVKGDSMLKYDSYRDYNLQTTWEDTDGNPVVVYRRYTHFIWLRDRLLRKYSECAVPILPEKFLLEKLQDNKSESIRERTRKIQHFFTLIISHPFLKNSDEVVEFLTMNNEVFAQLLKSEQELENNRNSSRKSGWFESARNSFSGFMTKAKDLTIKSISNVLSGAKSEDTASEQQVSRVENNLLKLKAQFEALKELITEYSTIRYEESKIDHIFWDLTRDRTEFNDFAVTTILKNSSSIYEKHSEHAIDNKTKLEKHMFFQTESHLVWIESVVDLLQRRKKAKEELDEINRKLADPTNRDAQYDYWNLQTTLQNQIDRQTDGVFFELTLLKTGTQGFFKDNIINEFISNQQKYIEESFNMFDKFFYNELDDEYNVPYEQENTDERLGRERWTSFGDDAFSVFKASPRVQPSPFNRHCDDDDEEDLDDKDYD